MKKRKRGSSHGAMLDLWQPPEGAGDPVGCLATTYTFHPGLFDEQCLARFLEIESEPDREDLAFLIERETRLGGVYAGVLVDHTQAGVEHSLRWDVLPVRIRTGIQHAKLSLLSWTRRLRIIVASANLTEPGYRTNFEVVVAVDLRPDDADRTMLQDAVTFLRRLVDFVPGASDNPPEVRRVRAFLDQVERQVGEWRRPGRRGGVRRQLVFTLPPPPGSSAEGGLSSLDQAMATCQKRGWVAHRGVGRITVLRWEHGRQPGNSRFVQASGTRQAPYCRLLCAGLAGRQSEYRAQAHGSTQSRADGRKISRSRRRRDAAPRGRRQECPPLARQDADAAIRGLFGLADRVVELHLCRHGGDTASTRGGQPAHPRGPRGLWAREWTTRSDLARDGRGDRPGRR